MERTLRQSFVSGFMLSPSLHYFIKKVTKVNINPGKLLKANSMALKIGNILYRSSAHLLILTPLLTGQMLLGLSTIKHRSLYEGFNDLIVRFKPTLEAAYQFWPLIIVSLYSRKIPKRFATLLKNGFAFSWAIILSNISN